MDIFGTFQMNPAKILSHTDYDRVLTISLILRLIFQDRDDDVF